MNKINYILYMLLAMFLIVGCEEDTVKEKEEEEEVIDHGAVEALFETRFIRGELTTEVDMGDTISLADISNGRPDIREWTVTNSDGSVVVELDDSKIHNFIFTEGDMDYNIQLRVERTSDGEIDELLEESYIHVNKIDVLADFLTNGEPDTLAMADGGGDYMVGRNVPLTFLNKSKGVPDEFEWDFEEGTPLTSDMNNIDVVYIADGLYEAKLMATRSSDGSTSEVTKLIRVAQNYTEIEKMSVNNETITLTYDFDLMEDVSVAMDYFSVEIITAAGTTINPVISSFSASGKDLIIVLDQGTYSDDVVVVNYDGDGILTASNTAFIARKLVKAHAVDVNNMFFMGEFDGGFDNWIDKKGNQVIDVWRSEGNRSDYDFEVSKVNTLSGEYSGYFEVGYNGSNYADILQLVDTYHAVSADEEYQIGYWIYIEEMTGAQLDLSIYWRRGVDTWWDGANAYTLGSITDVGRWIYVTGTVGTGLLNGDSAHFMWRIRDPNYKIYMDNMKMYPVGSYRARP